MQHKLDWLGNRQTPDERLFRHGPVSKAFTWPFSHNFPYLAASHHCLLRKSLQEFATQSTAVASTTANRPMASLDPRSRNFVAPPRDQQAQQPAKRPIYGKKDVLQSKEAMKKAAKLERAALLAAPDSGTSTPPTPERAPLESAMLSLNIDGGIHSSSAQAF